MNKINLGCLVVLLIASGCAHNPVASVTTTSSVGSYQKQWDNTEKLTKQPAPDWSRLLFGQALDQIIDEEEQIRELKAQVQAK